jgi:hypothetical protein
LQKTGENRSRPSPTSHSYLAPFHPLLPRLQACCLPKLATARRHPQLCRQGQAGEAAKRTSNPRSRFLIPLAQSTANHTATPPAALHTPRSTRGPQPKYTKQPATMTDRNQVNPMRDPNTQGGPRPRILGKARCRRITCTGLSPGPTPSLPHTRPLKPSPLSQRLRGRGGGQRKPEPNFRFRRGLPATVGEACIQSSAHLNLHSKRSGGTQVWEMVGLPTQSPSPAAAYCSDGRVSNPDHFFKSGSSFPIGVHVSTGIPSTNLQTPAQP